MESHCISFREIPHTTRLLLDFLYEFPRVASFYPCDPFGTDIFVQAAEKISTDPVHRSTVADVLTEQNRCYEAGSATEENIERLRTGQAMAVVTGQQVGLFTGPVYSIYKALTALRLAQKLTAEGVPAVPIFWLAAQDHDLAEVNHCVVLNAKHRLHRLEHRPAAPAQMRVGEIPLGESITELRQELRSLWVNAPDTAELDTLAATYEPDVTYVEAFACLLHRLLAGMGLIVINPLDPRLNRLAAPLLRRVLEQAEPLQQRLLERKRALDRAGYHNQVHLRQNATLLFLNVDSTRQAVRRRGGSFEVVGRGLLNANALLEELNLHPERFTPNVLLRPLIQDTLLPTVAYVAGPAEVAYFAQASTLYEVLLGRMPVIFPRASFTLVDRTLGRLLTKYRLQPCDLFRAQNQVFTQMAQRYLPRDLQRRLKATEKKLEKTLAEVAPSIAKLDPTLAGAVETSRRKMLYQFHKLSAKAARAKAFRYDLLERHLGRLSDALYPERALQERTLNIFSFLARYGLDLLPRLADQIRFPCRDHQVIYLDR
ncbi:MAG: bacillithiol biosynthesis cysteine-adding enzyme BshC [Terriglobia bacterium]